MTSIEAVDRATHELEEILRETGWEDGWGKSTEEIRGRKPRPFFYRNAAETAATESRVSLEGQSEILYCIYTESSTDPSFSGNRSAFHEVILGLNFYYSNSALFAESEGLENPYARLLNGLLEELEDRLWAAWSDGEDGVASDDAGSIYLNHKTIYIKKVFS